MNALEIAAGLETAPDCTCHAAGYFECCCDATWPEQYMLTAAAELRRLQAENQRCRDVCAATAEGWREDRDALLEALKDIERSTYDAETAALARVAIAQRGGQDEP